MATIAEFLVLILLCTAVKISTAEVHKVGESAGWTVGAANLDYKAWAASKTFLVGDTIVFEYNKQFHNVLQVSLADYRSCNVSSPIASHSSGNDSIPVKRRGHYFFLCGVPGHCAGGQKVDIRVVSLVSAPTSAPTSSPSPLSTLSGLGTPIAPPVRTNLATKTAAMSSLGGIISVLFTVLVL
ncbi:mavicyanin [Aristolochia californica]|uniref:mavicyanin n=1 Tax=Aristolochia californica TaxID=171875 RepID=UPI0035D64F68